MPLLPTGLEVYRTADYLQIARDRIDAELALRGIAGVDYERALVMGICSTVIASLLGDSSETLQAVYDSRDPGNAQGVQLSSISVATGTTRNEATESVVPITCTGTAGTILPAGRLIRGGDTDGEALWESRADATIGGGGTVDVDFEAQEEGAKVAPAGTEWDIVTAVYGWTSATNPVDDAVVGEDRETDDELRIRRQESLQIGGAASARAIRAELLEIDAGAQAAVLENDDTATQVIEDVTITGHTVAVYLLPTTLDDAAKDLAVRAIYDKKSAGVLTQGTESAVVTEDGLAPVTIYYSWGVEVAVTVTITLKMDTLRADPIPYADAVVDLTALLATEYTPNLQLSTDVTILDHLAYVDRVDGVRSAGVVITATDLDADGNAVVNAFEVADVTYVFVDGT